MLPCSFCLGERTMKTFEILNLDCGIEKNKTKVNKFLFKVKPIAKEMEKAGKTGIVPIEILEKVLHGISLKYDYRHQGIMSYYEKNEFVFYTISITKKRKTVDWIGNEYGKTMWELLAKTIIKIYADIMKERE